MHTVTPSLTRVVSCRHSRKISCETLTHITVEPHCKGTSFYYSYNEKGCRKKESSSGDGEASELDSTSSGHSSLASHYLQRVRELERNTGKLDHPSYGVGKAPRHKFLACWLSKASHMPAARRAKEVERLRKYPRAYPSAIHGTGGVLPHGSQSSHLSSTASSTSLRASASILPQNAVGGKMNPSDPSSPKVTCLGRVKNKQKHIGKCTSTTSEHQHDVFCTLVPKRGEKKNVDAEVVESASKKTSARMGSGNAIVVNHSDDLSKGTNSQNPGGKGTASPEYVAKAKRKRWSLRETTRQEENAMSYQNQEKLQANGATALVALSLEAEFSIDLSRFGDEQGHEMVVRNDSSQRFERNCVPAPPPNALLLIRNRKVRDDDEVSALSASTCEHGTSLLGALDPQMDNTVATQTSVSSSSTHHESDQVLPLFPEMGMKKPITVADILRSMSSPLTSEMVFTSSCASQKSERFERKFSVQTEYAGVCRQACLPKEPSETRLWQRRAIEKPCTLKIRKLPVRGQINRRAAVWVNKK